MKRALRDYLEDMLCSAREALEFTEGMDFAMFCHDRKTFNAVLRSLEVLGEAAKKIPKPVRAKYPDLPWQEMAGMRDKLIHEYHGVDERIVWKTVREDIPPLIPLLERILREESQ